MNAAEWNEFNLLIRVTVIREERNYINKLFQSVF